MTCVCGHRRVAHMGGELQSACEADGCSCPKLTAPADAGTAGYTMKDVHPILEIPLQGPEPPPATRVSATEPAEVRLAETAGAAYWQCGHPRGALPHTAGCEVCGCKVTAEPEAPEPSTCRTCGIDWEPGHACDPDYLKALEGLRRMKDPRRPPYAVAYEVQGGAQYEIALPGDATIRAHEGALIITHASAVMALLQCKPMEG